MKKLLLFVTGCILYSILYGQPIINSFSPQSGPIGAVLTITGSNFSSSLANNVVFFGAVRANVSSASTTSLTVTIPLGATYDPITVTTLNNNLTAYSKRPYHVTFPGAGPGFTPASFDSYVNFAVGIHPHAISNVDLDMDEKPDFISPNYDGSTYSMLKNNSNAGALIYSSNIEATTPGLPAGVVAADFDGDGDMDIAITSWNASNVSILKNISTSGTILFAPRIEFPTGTNPEGIATGDIDGDGKPDLVTADVNLFTVSVLRNTSSGGAISFAAPVSFPSGFNPRAVIISDLDGDGKSDIAAAVETTNKIAVFRNTSSVGLISFDPRVELSGGTRPWGIAVGDFDGDGKPDLVCPNNGSLNASVFRNISIPGIINFSPNINLSVGEFPQKVAVTDLDGDGNLDLAITNNAGFNSIVSLYKNTSTSGSIQFLPKVDFVIGAGPTAVTIGDMDGDGLPDIAATARNGNAISILRNTTVCTAATISTQPFDSTVCAGSNAAFSVIASNAVSYQWQVDNGSGWVNITNNATYSGATTNVLSITNAIVSMNNYKYRCVVSNSCAQVNSSFAVLIVNTPSAPSINIIASNTTICQGATVTFTATPVNGGLAPAFQWKKNGLNVGTNSNTYSDNTLNNGDIINCVLTSNSLCVTTNTANSNDVIITVSAPVTPSNSISASTNNVCFGTTITFTAIPTNGGTAPAYQWKKNGINVGTNSSTHTDNTLNNGDIMTCVLTSNFGCVTSNTSTSNQVIMNIIPAVTPTITISVSANNICPGTAVTFTAVSTNGGPSPSYQWKKNGINVGTNNPAYTDNSINNGDIITCVLTSNLVANCLTTNTATGNAINMTLQILPGPVDLGADKAGCSGNPVILSVQPGYLSYLWQDGSTNSVYSVNNPGQYYLNVVDVCGNNSSDTVNISFNSVPSRFLPTDTSICSYTPVLLKPLTVYNQYLWSTNSTASSITINSPGIYWLQVTDNNQCLGRDSITVYPKNCLRGFYMPNAFTPNNDATNDNCKPIIVGTIKQYEFTIYNRYGEVVFQSSEPGKGWDGKINGKPQHANVFAWVCSYQLEGQLLNLEKGTVVLIR